MKPIVCCGSRSGPINGSSTPMVIMTIDLQKGAWATIIAQLDLGFDQRVPCFHCLNIPDEGSITEHDETNHEKGLTVVGPINGPHQRSQPHILKGT